MSGAFLDWCPPGRSSQSHLGNGSFRNFEWQRFEKGLEICRVISFETKKCMGIMECESNSAIVCMLII